MVNKADRNFPHFQGSKIRCLIFVERLGVEKGLSNSRKYNILYSVSGNYFLKEKKIIEYGVNKINIGMNFLKFSFAPFLVVAGWKEGALKEKENHFFKLIMKSNISKYNNN